MKSKAAPDESIFAVITGDVSKSSNIPVRQRGLFLDHLKGLFQAVKDTWPDLLRTPFQIYRGDGFQAVLSDPSYALKIAVVLRAGLRSGFHTDETILVNDARIAIGIGSIDFLPAQSSAEGDGEAFRRSGQLLDRMISPFHLLVNTAVGEIDDELNVELGLLDAIISKWSPEQAEAMLHHVLDRNQREIARTTDVSPAAINQRLKTAGGRFVDNALERFEYVIKSKVCDLNQVGVKGEG